MKTILITGGNGILATELFNVIDNTYKVIALGKDELDITNFGSIQDNIIKHSPDIIIHCAAMTNPLNNHEKFPRESIEKNIIGTGFLAMLCSSSSTIKLVYISTDYVYEDQDGKPISEQRGSCGEGSTNTIPFTNYGWSKLGGECSVLMCPNHLILRSAHTNRPFKHDKALTDSYKSSIYVDDASKMMWELIKHDCAGVYNVGGLSKTIYDFAKETNPDVKPISRKDVKGLDYYLPRNVSLDVYETEIATHIPKE